MIEIEEYEIAKISSRKAIEINPDHPIAYCNLSNIFRAYGKLKESEMSIYKALKIEPNLTKAYFNLSILQTSINEQLLNTIFSESILKKKTKEEQIDIYFARANILHR